MALLCSWKLGSALQAPLAEEASAKGISLSSEPQEFMDMVLSASHGLQDRLREAVSDIEALNLAQKITCPTVTMPR